LFPLIDTQQGTRQLVRAQKIGTIFKFRSIERQIARQNTEMSPVEEVSSKIGANLLGNRATICGNGVTNSKWQRKVVVIRFF
jgi:hypothetical protein